MITPFNMNEFEEVKKRVRNFTQERDWDQFHDGQNLAIALQLEASELLEAYLWKKAEDVKIEKVKEELADVFNYAFLIADKYDLDVKQIILQKMEKMPKNILSVSPREHLKNMMSYEKEKSPTISDWTFLLLTY